MPRPTRDITSAFWAFVGIMTEQPPPRPPTDLECDDDDDDNDLPVFKSEAYREMCAAVHSGDALMVGVHPGDSPGSFSCHSTIIFDDITALFRGKEAIASIATPARALQFERCVRRVQSWVDAEELSTLFDVTMST